MFPKVVDINGFFLPSYGLLVALAFLTGLWMATRLARRQGLNADAVANLAIYCALSAMLGAKLLMFILDAGYYTQNPAEIFSVASLQAGGVFFGGLLAALVTAFFYMRAKKLPGLMTADVFAPGVALGHAIGRLGCFAAGCCWGQPSSLPWAVTFTNPEANAMVGVPLHVALHPTQIYEALAEVSIALLLYVRFGRPHAPGRIIGLYLILYSCARFLIEFLRAHDQAPPFGLPFSASQWIALALLAAGIWLTMRTRAGSTDAVPARAGHARP